jgi:D-threo-aldose 1-dehydrogenase
MVGGLYNGGVLADPAPGSMFDYEPAPHAVVVQARRLAQICADHDVPLKAAALQFPFQHASVTSALTGPRSVAELEENVELMRHPVPDELWSLLG